MSKLRMLMRQTGNSSLRSFLSQADMAIIKHDTSVSDAARARDGSTEARGAYCAAPGS